MPYSVHFQLEYRKTKDKGENLDSKAGLHVLIAPTSSAQADKATTYTDLLSGIEKRTNKYYTI